ncbi:hypothetical protein ACFLTH_17780, partial [Bacteroidota bacterium]
ILLYVLLENWKKLKFPELIKELLKYSKPIFFLAAWYLFHYAKTGLFMYYQNIKYISLEYSLLNLVYFTKFLFFDQYRFILTLSIPLFFIRNKEHKINNIMTAMLSAIILFIAFFAWTNLGFIRHFIPVFPMFFIFSTHKLIYFIKKQLYLWLVIFVLVGLFISTYHAPTKFTYEENMKYFDVIRVQKDALAYIQDKNFQEKIWVDGYTYLNFGYPYMGYIDKALNIDLIPVKSWNFADDKQTFSEKVKKGELVLETSTYMKEMKSDYQIIHSVDLKLIKEFKRHNDFAKIYRVI